MQVVHERCAGLDVHKDLVVACLRIVEGSKPRSQIRRFATTTSALLALGDWLEDNRCTHVAMEATGIYWKPVWHLLEDRGLELVLANALHIKAVPGRKSDVNDAGWIAELLAHGLIRSSFVPPAAIQDVRDLTRTRKQLVREVCQHALRIQKTLEDANIKLSSVISNVLGVSGRAMLDAMIAGESDPAKLAQLADPHLKASAEELTEALRGRVTANHCFLLKLHLDQIDGLRRAIRDVEARLEDLLEPFRPQVKLLTTIPGVSETLAHVVIAEIGVDMSRFPTAAHLVSWSGLSPRLDESAGKHHSTRLRRGAPWLKPDLVQAAWCSVRAKKSYLRAQFYRLKSRRGPKKAIAAVAASMLTAIYYILRDGLPYRDLGPDYFDRLDKNKLLKRLTRRIEDLGYEVQLHPAA
jgi:transposase